MRAKQFGTVALVVAAALSMAGSALGSVRREGTWPDADRTVTLEAEGLSRSQAFKRLAEAAGWSVIYSGPAGDSVDLHIKDEPADKVLELLLSDGSYVATREGSRISIAVVRPQAAEVVPASSTPPAPPAPPPPPAVPSARGTDRVISGGSVRVEAGETVHDVAVFGGSADVFGTVTGDLTVMGGSAIVHDGAHVHGDASTVGGSLTVEDGARVDGDVATVGGRLERGERAHVGGDVKDAASRRRGDAASSSSRGSRIMSDASEAVTRSALLFVLGAVLLALGATRMDRLQAEIAARPMRSFALGVVGSFTAAVLFVLLCIIVVGIPFALVGALFAAIGAAVGLCATLTTVGAALLGHRTQSPYMHLAVGCFLLLVIGAIPYVGGFVQAAALLVGLGSLVATRGAGLVPTRTERVLNPYRTAAGG